MLVNILQNLAPKTIPLVAQGMDKTTNTTDPGSGLLKIVDLIARAGSTVVNNGLKVKGTGNASITASVEFTEIDYGGHNVRVYLNGAQIAQSPSSDRGTITFTFAHALKNDDLIELYKYTGSGTRTSYRAAYLSVAPAA